MKVKKLNIKKHISVILSIVMILLPVSNINAFGAVQTSGLNSGAAAQAATGSAISFNKKSAKAATDSAIETTDNTYAGDGYEVKFNVDSKWDGAFNGSITITNTGNKAIENWELSFEMQNNITNIWNAVITSHEGNTYKIKNAGWNQDIEAGKSVTFGFGASYNSEITIPSEYQMLGKEQEVSEEKCKISYSISSQWDTGYVMEVTITNISDKAIEDWEILFDLGNEITNIWNGKIISNANGQYDIKNCSYNANISAGGSVSFGFQASITDKDIALIPKNGTLKQVAENDASEADQNWSQKMINADAENVIAARKQVNNVVKVAFIDSGINYSQKMNDVKRKNFLPGYEEEDLNPMFDDLTGHGSAAAALIASDPSKKPESGKDDQTDEDDSKQENVDFSFLTNDDKLALTPQLDEDLLKFYQDTGEEMHVRTDSSEDNGESEAGEQDILETTEAGNASEAAGEEISEENTDQSEDIENLMDTGIEGINPNVQIYSARVLDENNEAPVSRVVEAIDWAIEQNVNIINLSWGVDKDSPELYAAIKRAYQNGILMIAAAGNGNSIQYPAKYKEVMAVGSVKCTGKKADDSATGEELEVVAPGQDVVSFGPFGIPDTFSGTSMAAPQVTGLASILWQKDTTKSNEFIRQLIDATAKNLGDKKVYGYGLIDCEYAISQYDNFTASYVENSTSKENINNAMEAGTLDENGGKLNTFLEATIKGSWGPSTHIKLVNNMGIVQDGAQWPDNPASGLKGMKEHPGFHGFYKDINGNNSDYIAAYIYLTEQATSYKASGTGIEKYTASGANIETVHKDFINNIGKVNGWSNYTNEQKALFIYGMALHTVGDIFAHSTWAYQGYRSKIVENTDIVVVDNNIAWSRINHGYKINGKYYDNNADDTKDYDKRYDRALDVSRQIIANSVKKYKIGTIYDFNCKYYSSIYNIGNSTKARIKYLKEAFGIEKFDTYILSKMKPSETDNDFVNRINGITNKNIKNIVKKWNIAKIKLSDKIDITYNTYIQNFIIYKPTYKEVDGTQRLVSITEVQPIKSGKYYCLVLNKNEKYILVAKLQKKQTSKAAGSLSLLAVSETADRYVCTKELCFNEEDQSGYLDSDDYQTMCLGNEIELDEADFVTASLEGKITVADTDSDNSNDKALQAARISLTEYNDASYQLTVISDNQGKYVFSDLAPGIYNMVIQEEGYLDAKYTVIIHSSENNVFNPVIAMISEKYEGKGSASGNIVDAADGIGVEGLTLRFRKGLNETKDTVLMEVKTGTDGLYTVKNLDTGYYTVQIIDEREVSEKEKYQNGIMTVMILGSYTINNQNGVVTNNLKTKQLRIVLTWGSTPRDLDSHLLGKTSDGVNYHIYYHFMIIKNSQNNVEAKLDVDDTSSYGPETTTIYQPVDDDYEFYVYNYTHNSNKELMNSGAMVQVYRGSNNQPWYTFYVPQEEGYYWKVFNYNGETGKLTPNGKVTM